MRKLMLVTLIATLVAAAFAPAHAGRRTRQATSDYTMAEGMVTFDSQAHWTVGTEPHVFTAKRAERAVTFSIADSIGRPVRGHAVLDTDGDGQVDHRAAAFCGETTQPIAVRPGQRVQVRVLMGTCEDGTPSIVTQGTITATFTR